MNGRYLLDTNIVIALFASDPAVTERLKEAEEVFIPSIVFGELYYGARNSSRVVENVAKIEEFRAASAVLACDATTALHYGEVKFNLKRKGTPIPENDIWIAALAHQYDLVIVSRDQHFDSVDTVAATIW
jgi:tRNA(fMet)-specific endonuclease VapC